MKNLLGYSFLFLAFSGPALLVALWLDIPEPDCLYVSAVWAAILVGRLALPRRGYGSLSAEGRAEDHRQVAEYEAFFDKQAAIHGARGARRIIELCMKQTRYGLTQKENAELLAYKKVEIARLNALRRAAE